MPKKAKTVQVLEMVPSNLLENFVIKSCNLTTNEQSTYEILSSKSMTINEHQLQQEVESLNQLLLLENKGEDS